MLVLPDGLLEYLGENGGGVLHVAEAADSDALEAGLRAAVRRIDAIRHPEEPTESLANSVYSSATELFADMPDVVAFDGILEAVIAAFEAGLAEAGVTEGVVRFGRDPNAKPVVKEPKPPFEMPANFPMPIDAEVIDRQTRNQDTGGLQLATSMPVHELVGFYLEALPSAGYEVTDVESVRSYYPRQGEFEGSMIRVRWPGWEGHITALGRTAADIAANASLTTHPDLRRVSVAIRLRTALTFEQARRDSGIDVTPRRRNEFRSQWWERVPPLLGPSDLGPNWSMANVGRNSSGCFCDRDTVIRKGPNEKRGLLSGGGFLLEHNDAPCWIEHRISAHESEAEARDMWAWIPLDLKHCEEFRGEMPIGPVEEQAAGRWREVPGTDPDQFDGDVNYNTRSGRLIVGHMTFVIFDRFIARLFAHAVHPEPAPDVAPLLPLVRERMQAISREFPPQPPL